MNHMTKWTHSSAQHRILPKSQKALKIFKIGLKKLVKINVKRATGLFIR